MNYLLDTNAAIGIINDRPEGFRARFHRALAQGETFGVSSVVLFELWFGVANSNRWTEAKSALETFISSPVVVIDFDHQDARAAAEIRATLKKTGKPVGSYDLLIAAQAIRRNATLITANVSEFSRVPGLDWQDWSKD